MPAEADGARSSRDKTPDSGCMGVGGVGEGFSEEVTPEWSFGGQLSFQVWRVMGRREGEIVEVEEGPET